MSEQAARDPQALVRLVEELLAQLDGTIVTMCEFRSGDNEIMLRRSVSGIRMSAAEPADDEDVVPATWIPILSPLTGIFYLTESPQSPPFVTVGASISLRQIVGLIESMKMYNPVESDIAGVVRSILVQASAVVEKGQILMYVEPAGDPE
jgi:acetyl-CoA carboxylase biotin carboxyl carrier protein